MNSDAGLRPEHGRQALERRRAAERAERAARPGRATGQPRRPGAPLELLGAYCGPPRGNRRLLPATKGATGIACILGFR